MRLLVFGSRTFLNKKFLYETLDELHARERIDLIIEGEATGADTLAREWAESRDVHVRKYPADWYLYGKAAGPIRNRQMITEGNPDMAIGFVDKPLSETRGSRNMNNQAVKAGIPVRIYEVEL